MDGHSPEMTHPQASLFVLALPRSLSSLIFHAARIALGHTAPTWTTDGELLNLDRFGVGVPSHRVADKYRQLHTSPRAFDALQDFLDRHVAGTGHVYKDVVQPFACAAWLGAGRLPVLKLRRDPAEVALSMRDRDWRYPAGVASLAISRDDPDTALVEGLLRAWRAIDAVPGATLDYDAACDDESAFLDALARAHPQARIARIGYIDDEFRKARQAQRARRDTAAYRRMADRVARVREALDVEAAASTPPLERMQFV